MTTARKVLNELLTDPTNSVGSRAVRVHKSERLIRMTLSLAFLAPNLAKAATEGQLPRGFGIKRLIDLPMLWSWVCFLEKLAAREDRVAR